MLKRQSKLCSPSTNSLESSAHPKTELQIVRNTIFNTMLQKSTTRPVSREWRLQKTHCKLFAIQSSFTWLHLISAVGVVAGVVTGVETLFFLEKMLLVLDLLLGFLGDDSVFFERPDRFPPPSSSTSLYFSLYIL